MSASGTARGGRSPRSIAGQAWSLMALPIVSIVLALLVGAVLILASELLITNRKFNLFLPLEAYRWLFVGGFGDFDAVVRTLVFTAPLLFAGLAVGLGFRAGLFNIGVLGQFLMGALGATWVGLMLRDAPSIIGFPLALIAGAIGGAIWGFIPGFLKAQSGAHEVVTTIMLNYVAIDLIAAAASGPLKAPGSPNPVTQDIGNAGLPILLGRDGHLGIVVAVLAAFFISWLLYRTTVGFEIRVVGASPDAARYAGMRPKAILMLTMALSGLLGGLAGAGQILGINHQLNAAYSTTVGFDGIAVALLGRSNPVGITAAAVLFGAMRAGAGPMQINAAIPTELVDVLQATILLFLVAGPVLRKIFGLRGAKGLAVTDTISATYGGSTEVVAH